MARPLRLEFAGALYHVTSRGNEQRSIVRSDRDRRKFFEFLGQTVSRFGWSVTAAVLMTNHFHLIIQTPEPNLSRGMHWFNSAYAGWYNHTRKRCGHLYQGRFKAFLIEKEAYLAEASSSWGQAFDLRSPGTQSPACSATTRVSIPRVARLRHRP